MKCKMLQIFALVINDLQNPALTSLENEKYNAYSSFVSDSTITIKKLYNLFVNLSERNGRDKSMFL